jgi:hypothetical protein
LNDKIKVIRGQMLFNGFSAMANHYMDLLWSKLAGTVNYMRQHRLTGNWMKDLGQSRSHTGALPRSKNDDFKGHVYASIWPLSL